MAVKKFAVGCFTEEGVLFEAVKKVRKAGYKLHDVYTPMPIHGLDKAMGLRDTSIHTAGFLYAITGTTTILSFMTWAFTTDWPLNIGGKPHFALPAFIPITFEFTVLCSCVGMVLTFCYLCNLAPFVKKHHFHPRATDDKFVMVIEITPKNTDADVTGFLTGLGAEEVNVQNAETGWWLGTYDKEQKLIVDETVSA
jgi:ActD protein